MRIDVHIHLAGQDGPSGSFISEEMQRNAAYALMLALTGNLLKKVNDKTIRDHLLGVLNGSKLVDRAVFLALDKVCEADGTASTGRTQLYTPNDYAAGLAQRESKVLFGASVHPNRPDALEELARVAELGAVLVKWIPSSQDIEPLLPRYKPFYRELARLGLPLLWHTGAEHAIPPAGGVNTQRAHTLNHPLRTVPALEEGVTVIACHCATPVFPTDPNHLDDFIGLMALAKKEGWKLYADVSALAAPLPHRMTLLGKVVKELPHDRLILGSDYPIPIVPLLPGTAGEVDLSEWADAVSTANALDRNVKVIRALGFHKSVLTNAEKVLRLP